MEIKHQYIEGRNIWTIDTDALASALIKHPDFIRFFENETEMLDKFANAIDKLLPTELAQSLIADYFNTTESKLNQLEGKLSVLVTEVLHVSKQSNANRDAIGIFKTENDNKLKTITNTLYEMKDNSNIFWRAFQVITFATALFAVMAWVISNY